MDDEISDDEISDDEISDDEISDDEISDDEICDDEICGNRFELTSVHVLRIPCHALFLGEFQGRELPVYVALGGGLSGAFV